MAKRPAVIGVLTEPAPPTWWRAHRHQVFLILGLIGGFYIGTHSSGDAATTPDKPQPTHTAPANPSVKPLPKPTPSPSKSR
ncbi:hypothetical protein [Streptomyces sp. NPDC047525]|uniref:hypothetical protein n=1 Tax=Streptomyces sp. NPDC047525 TaxID=3155264 RepID=UPI0033E7AC4C